MIATIMERFISIMTIGRSNHNSRAALEARFCIQWNISITKHVVNAEIPYENSRAILIFLKSGSS